MIKYIIIIFGIILAIFGLIYGSLLPFAKAKIYVRAMGNLQSIKSLDEFKKNFDPSLDFYSPVGQEETSRFLATEIIGRMIYPDQKENISRELVNYIEPRFFQNNSRHLLLAASMYGKMFNIYGKKDDLKKTEEYFQKSLILNPKSPQALYSLFEIYYKKGEFEKSKQIGGIMLKYWPEDERIKEAFKHLNIYTLY